ncbi:MAG: 5-oxoprolinase subunit PxpA [Proteobacteria bacterium]|nr:5-oxoprolinase subunit PxpA [Pseudomonadota bacterium]MBU4582696.1 5-oxoprolinase subunit PxpA [Pseudomonadota bacterium]MCG2742171.1 5-oxoprolinase subunit PxpA [Syntrophaceae bacterium]
MKKVDLNCDMGESFGAYTIGMDDEVIKYITSANVACGFHAGDPLVLDRTVKLAVEHNVAVGAHPGYPDLQGFGRRNMNCTLEEIRNYVVYQIGALQAFCAIHGTRLRHVKPHGSLYNTAAENEGVARVIAEAIASVDSELIYVALASAKEKIMSKIARDVGLKVVYEAFPDRAYTPEGTLLSRRLPGAVVRDARDVAERALMMAKEGKVIAVDGTPIQIDIQTLCVHGDTPMAVELVRAIREKLEADGMAVTPMGEL